ncbi:MAG: PEP-CTERM sorting domain-containing protein, partial [Kiritimatiellales bacterium]|nr:PEP-CTERM sorting domain-containing protein [Kiritimatiellales bacterium]
DIDGEPSAKTTLDINGNGRTTDGYVRTTDGQSGGVFGLTTFIDFAVSWNYLEIYTNLRSNQTWTVGLASIANATDHNVFNADVSGATLTNDIDVGWSAPVAVPEPASALMIGLGAGLIFLVRRICNRN